MSKPEFKVDILVVNIDKCKPREDNPRTINRKEYDDLKKSIKDFPEMKQLREIIVDEDFNILAGTQRWYVQKDLGYADILVKQAIGLTDKQKRRFMALDNHHSGKWDEAILKDMWNVDELKDWGIDTFDFGDIAEPKEPKAKDGAADKDSIECPNCGCLIDI